MTKETLKQDIKIATSKLLKMTEESCWNRISDNCVYIVSEIKASNGKNFFEQRVERKRKNDKKRPKTLEQIIVDLESRYKNLYDVNLYIYHAKKDKTIVEIQYLPKSSLETDYYEKVKDNKPMLHSKIGIPPYRGEKTERYDVNWELGGLRHDWKMFWWKRKIGTQIK
jgi:replication-associated recombination protein RarA